MSKNIAADHVKLKRAYEPPTVDDGTRILIDRLWPRGVKKANAAIDEWMKEIAPSTELRKWFGHDPERWPEFQRRYKSEIQRHHVQLERLRALARQRYIRRRHESLRRNAELLLPRPRKLSRSSAARCLLTVRCRQRPSN